MSVCMYCAVYQICGVLCCLLLLLLVHLHRPRVEHIAWSKGDAKSPIVIITVIAARTNPLAYIYGIHYNPSCSQAGPLRGKRGRSSPADWWRRGEARLDDGGTINVRAHFFQKSATTRGYDDHSCKTKAGNDKNNTLEVSTV